MKPNIELVYDPDCPNVRLARTHLSQALAATGLAPIWQEWNRSSQDTPPHARGTARQPFSSTARMPLARPQPTRNAADSIRTRTGTWNGRPPSRQSMRFCCSGIGLFAVPPLPSTPPHQATRRPCPVPPPATQVISKKSSKTLKEGTNNDW